MENTLDQNIQWYIWVKHLNFLPSIILDEGIPFYATEKTSNTSYAISGNMTCGAHRSLTVAYEGFKFKPVALKEFPLLDALHNQL
jgi:hypothetical protein